METISDSSGIRGSVESLIGGREENQDSYGMAETRLGMLVVVCDGMGGGPGGKTASSIAVQAIIDYVSGAPIDANPVSILEDAAMSANESVRGAVEANPSLKGMGTTCVCVLVTGSEAHIMHVGDSRCYQLRGDKAVFRTADHSYVGELVRRGSLSEEEARTSQYSNVITRAVGASPDIQAEVDTVKIRPGDRFALMTDGIWGMLPEPQLIGIIGYDEEPTSLVPQITARIDADGRNKGGRHDNLTLALVDLPEEKGAFHNMTVNDRYAADRTSLNSFTSEEDSIEQGTNGKSKDKKTLRIIIFILMSALAIAIGVIAWLVFSGNKQSVSELQKNPTDQVAVSDATMKPDAKPLPYDNSKNKDIYLNVIKTLESVKAYKPADDDKSSVTEIEQKRKVMIEECSHNLKQLSLTVTEENLKTKIFQTAENISSKADLMKRVDGKWRHSRLDANDEIDKNIKDVKALMD